MRRAGFWNLLVLLVSGALVLGLLEVGVRASALALRQREAARQAASPSTAAEEPLSRRVLHPFVGYTQRPRTLKVEHFYIEDYRTLERDQFVIGVAGGSVAAGVARKGGSTLASELGRRRPELAGKVRVIDLALGGYKQPQQLNLLMLMLLLGAPLDAVVTVDGFNEVALSALNAKRGIHPVFPHYPQMNLVLDAASGIASMAEVELTADLIADRRRADSLRALLDRHAWLRRSELLSALFGIFITSAEDRAVHTEERLADLASREHASALATLDDACLGEWFACQELIISMWRRASVMMKAVAEEHDVVYLHALQPNQYLAGSKRLTAEERSEAWDPDHPRSQAAARAYPELRRAGQALRRAGVDFRDLSMLFRDRPETIYSDVCCHYVDRGYELIAEQIAAYLDEALRRRGELAEPNG